MLNYETILEDLIETLKKNIKSLSVTKITPLSQVKPPKSPGVYMLFFAGELKYIGSSGNLKKRLRTNLISGNRKSHTLINKLCELKKWDVSTTVSFLRDNAEIKLIATETEDDAKILEEILITIYQPYYNIPLRKLKKKTKS